MRWRADEAGSTAICRDEAPEGVLVVSAWSPSPPQGRFRARISLVTNLEHSARRTVEITEPEQVIAVVSQWLSALDRGDSVGLRSDSGLSAD